MELPNRPMEAPVCCVSDPLHAVWYPRYDIEKPSNGIVIASFYDVTQFGGSTRRTKDLPDGLKTIVKVNLIATGRVHVDFYSSLK